MNNLLVNATVNPVIGVDCLNNRELTNILHGMGFTPLTPEQWFTSYVIPHKDHALHTFPSDFAANDALDIIRFSAKCSGVVL